MSAPASSVVLSKITRRVALIFLSWSTGLNTCVGERNYEDFFRVMLAIFAMHVFHLSTSLALCIDIFLEGQTESRADNWLGSESVVALLLFFIAFDAVSMLLLIQLIWFHLGLQKEQISTYQYIVRDHQRRRERVKLQRELDNQRAAALHKAEAEGRWIDTCKLTWGAEARRMGCGDHCDPLKMPTEVNEEEGFGASLGVANGIHNHGTSSDFDEEAVEDSDESESEPAVAEQPPPPAEEAPVENEPGVTFVPVHPQDTATASATAP